MIAVQKALFGRLAAEVRRSDNERYATAPLDALRFVEGGALEKDALATAKLLRLETVPGKGALALLNWQRRNVFCLPSVVRAGVDDAEDVDDPFENAGLSCLLFAEEKTPIAVSDPLQLVEYVFGTEGGYKFDIVAQFFSGFLFYRARSSLDNSPVAEVWSRCQALCAPLLRPPGGAYWTKEVVSEFEKTCRGPAAQVAGASLLSAAQASSWGHCFLEVYRSVEALFVVMSVEDLVNRLPAEVAGAKRAKLVDAIEESLQWRPKQDATLERLVSRLPDADVGRMAVQLGVEKGAVARTIYKARNKIAHGALRESPVGDPIRHLTACLQLVQSAYMNNPVPSLWLEDD